jgi:hypothetical protein
MLFNSRVIYSTLFFCLIMLLIAITKPKGLFDDKGRLRSFGIRSDETIMSYGSFSVILAITAHYVFSMIDLVNG